MKRSKFFISVGTRFPPELLGLILENIPTIKTPPPRYSLRRVFSQLSLVCRFFASHLRPLLFARLTLGSTLDLRILVVILRSKVSSWLSGHIRTVILREFHWQDLKLTRQFSLLFPLLPSVETVEYTRQGRPELKALGDRATQPALPLTSRRPFTKMLRLSHLTLDDQKFESFVGLADLLRSIPLLESASLHRVTWSRLYGSERLPIRGDGFSKIESLSAESCTQHWPLVLLFITSILPQSRRGNKPGYVTEERCLIETIAKIAMPSQREQCKGQSTQFRRRCTNGAGSDSEYGFRL